MTTSVTLFGTWLAFEFIHVTFLFFSLSFSLILSLYPFFFLYFSLSNLLLTVAQEKTVVQIGSDRHVVHIILYTRSLERGLSLVFDSSRNREKKKEKASDFAARNRIISQKLSIVIRMCPPTPLRKWFATCLFRFRFRGSLRKIASWLRGRKRF